MVDVTVSLIFRDVMPKQANPQKGVILMRGHIVILEFINHLKLEIEASLICYWLPQKQP